MSSFLLTRENPYGTNKNYPSRARSLHFESELYQMSYTFYVFLKRKYGVIEIYSPR